MSPGRALTDHQDRREIPAYPLAEAARYVRLAPATLRAWVVGRPYPKRDGKGYFQPLIRPADPKGVILSFNNLIEAHVLRALRTEHGVSIKAVRDALRYAERAFHIDRLLLKKDLRTAAGELFLERYGQLVSLSRSGQLAMRKLLDAYLQRVDWDDSLPIRLYPFVSGELTAQRPIAIDPNIAFGRPVLSRSSISTAAIAERIDAGESIEDVAADYGLEREEVEEAVLYERAA
ncbi:MAG: DUF433 domain-containing protein [Gemmatimonadaceae bacterium]|nr:DUF433 domain-containing protein [Gemmatimonadaceae bacterium]